MTTPASETAVRTEIVVKAPVDKAFRLFTDKFDQIKPRDHTMLDVDISESVLEPRVGGRVYDRGVDGSECRWARILAYDPPHRVVFSWDIGPTWQVETNPDHTSEVEVTFTAETPDRTRVELEHRHIDRHGPGWEQVRDGIGHDQGWPLYLDRYAALFGQAG